MGAAQSAENQEGARAEFAAPPLTKEVLTALETTCKAAEADDSDEEVRNMPVGRGGACEPQGGTLHLASQVWSVEPT